MGVSEPTVIIQAGLFSAVVTTFLVQVSEILQPDYTQISSSILYELLVVQRAIGNGSAISLTPLAPSPSADFTPSTAITWVNGLWYASLTLSLITALVAALAKQWLHQYLAMTTGTPRDRSLIRQYRYDGFERWHVEAIIAMLPVTLHTAVSLFFIGLVIYLSTLHAAFAYVVGSLSGVAYAAYLVSHVLVAFDPQCPYRTPLANAMFILRLDLRSLATRMGFWFHRQRYWTYLSRRIAALFRCLRLYLVTPLGMCFRGLWSPTPPSPYSIGSRRPSVEDEVLKVLQGPELQYYPFEALSWLSKRSSNPTVQSLIVHPSAAAVIDPGKPVDYDVVSPLRTRLDGEFSALVFAGWEQDPEHFEMTLERLLRATLTLPTGFVNLAEIPRQLDSILPDPETLPLELQAVLHAYAANFRITYHPPLTRIISSAAIAERLVSCESSLSGQLRLRGILWRSVLASIRQGIQIGLSSASAGEADAIQVVARMLALCDASPSILHTYARWGGLEVAYTYCEFLDSEVGREAVRDLINPFFPHAIGRNLPLDDEIRLVAGGGRFRDKYSSEQWTHAYHILLLFIALLNLVRGEKQEGDNGGYSAHPGLILPQIWRRWWSCYERIQLACPDDRKQDGETLKTVVWRPLLPAYLSMSLRRWRETGDPQQDGKSCYEILLWTRHFARNNPSLNTFCYPERQAIFDGLLDGEMEAMDMYFGSTGQKVEFNEIKHTDTIPEIVFGSNFIEVLCPHHLK